MEYIGSAKPILAMAKKQKPKGVISRPKRKPVGLPLLIKWREYRGLTQEALAERAYMTAGNISQLENGLINHSAEGLQALAEALNCEQGHILMVDPTAPDAIWSVWERATPAERKQLASIGAALVKKAS